VGAGLFTAQSGKNKGAFALILACWFCWLSHHLECATVILLRLCSVLCRHHRCVPPSHVGPAGKPRCCAGTLVVALLRSHRHPWPRVSGGGLLCAALPRPAPAGKVCGVPMSQPHEPQPVLASRCDCIASSSYVSACMHAYTLFFSLARLTGVALRLLGTAAFAILLQAVQPLVRGGGCSPVRAPHSSSKAPRFKLLIS
jgi:hypothetical protein